MVVSDGVSGDKPEAGKQLLSMRNTGVEKRRDSVQIDELLLKFDDDKISGKNIRLSTSLRHPYELIDTCDITSFAKIRRFEG